MKSTVRNFLAITLSILISGANASTAGKKPSARKPVPSSVEVLKIAREAYVYALPMIFTDFTRQASKAPDNVFSHSHKFPDHTSRLVVAPNNDTNYSTSFLDLEAGPVVLTIPDTKDRYYVLPLMDAWTNVFASFGKRTTGTKEQKYLITGPGWKGQVPKGLTEVKSPTNLVWIIGRIQVNSPEDQANFVTPIQDQFKVTPLSNLEGGAERTGTNSLKYRTVVPELALVQNRTITVVQAVKKIAIENYFNYFNELLVKNPPLKDDAPLLKRLATIGIKPGAQFSLKDFDEETQAKLKDLPQEIYRSFDKGSSELAPASKNSGATLGEYKTDYLTRALVAYKGLGALGPKDAIYVGVESADKTPLTGVNRYVIHFEKGDLPPARAFWSLTMYDQERYLVANPIGRYAIGDRNDLKYNADGSLDIYVQHESPGEEKERNWLPAPSDRFSVILRIYWPTEQYVNNRSSWASPVLKKLNQN